MEERTTSVEVEIDGRKYHFSGVESEEYMQQAAAYINGKISKVKKINGYNHLDEDMKSMIAIVEVTDDYYREKKRAEDLEKLLMDRDQQITELKHELITYQMEAGKSSMDAQKRKEEYEKLKEENEILKELLDEEEAQKKSSYQKKQ